MKRRLWILLVGGLLLGMLVTVYVRANPNIFNESMMEHAHCIKTRDQIKKLTALGYPRAEAERLYAWSNSV